MFRDCARKDTGAFLLIDAVPISHLGQPLGYHHGPVTALYVSLAFLSSLMALIYLWGSDWAGGLALLLAICLLLAHAAFVNWSERRGISP